MKFTQTAEELWDGLEELRAEGYKFRLLMGAVVMKSPYGQTRWHAMPPEHFMHHLDAIIHTGKEAEREMADFLKSEGLDWENEQ